MKHILIILVIGSFLFAQPFITTEYLVDGSFDGAASVYATDMDGDGDIDIVGAAHIHGVFVAHLFVKRWKNPIN